MAAKPPAPPGAQHPGVDDMLDVFQGSTTAARGFMHERERLHRATEALCTKVGAGQASVHEASALDWSFKGLTPDDMKTLGMIIESNALPRLQTLDVYSNAIGDLGLRTLSEHWITVPNPALGLGQAPKIWLPTLRRFDLSHNGITVDGCATLAAAFARGALPALQVLNLGGNRIGNGGFVKLVAALPALRALYLGGTGVGDQGLGALLARPKGTGLLSTLEAIDLSWNQVSDAGCATLAGALGSGKLPRIRQVSLEGNPASGPSINKVLDVPIPRREELAPGWKAVVDGTSGRTYYYNKHTRATTWTMPTDS